MWPFMKATGRMVGKHYGSLSLLGFAHCFGFIFCICLFYSGLPGLPEGCGAVYTDPDLALFTLTSFSGTLTSRVIPAIYLDRSLKSLSRGSLTIGPWDVDTAWPASEGVGPGNAILMELGCFTHPSSGLLYSFFRPRAFVALQTRVHLGALLITRGEQFEQLTYQLRCHQACCPGSAPSQSLCSVSMNTSGAWKCLGPPF